MIIAKNPMQWGLYAKDGTGVAIEYEVDEKYFYKMKYVISKYRFPSQPELDSLENHDPNAINLDICNNSFFTKSVFWKSEKEFRRYFNRADLTVQNGKFFLKENSGISREALYLGPTIDNVTADKISIIAQNEGVRVIHTRRAFSSFYIVRDNRKSPLTA